MSQDETQTAARRRESVQTPEADRAPASPADAALETAPPVVAVCAGGRSERMGRDKARIVVAGTPLLERAVQAAVAAGAEVCVVGRRRPDDWQGPDVAFLPDDEPGLGPLGALATALRRYGRSIVLTPCDLPAVDAPLFRWLLEVAQAAPDANVAPRIDDVDQPLPAVYRPAVLTSVEARLAEHRRSLRGVLGAVPVLAVVPPAAIAAMIVDADRPEDLPGGHADRAGNGQGS